MPLEVGRPSAGYPFAWQVYSWLPGRAVDVADQRSEVLAEDLAAVVVSMRRLETSGVSWSVRGGPLREAEPDIEEAIDPVSNLIDANLAAEVWRVAVEQPEWTAAPVFIHGDLLPGNLLLDGGRLSGVIDFECMGVGDPAADVIAAWSVFAGSARDVFRERLQVDEAMWRRGRGWALEVGLRVIPYYATSNPACSAMALRMVNRVLDDYRGDP